MAQIANTYETFDAIGLREELPDTIFNITPDKTPALSLFSHRSIDTTHPEWQFDTLRTPVTTNNQPEGNDWTFGAITPTTRVGTYPQISEETIILSSTLEKTNKAGRSSELAYQTVKHGKELKTDMEVTLLSNNASSAGSGNGATNRTLAGARAWMTTNDDLGVGGASGGFSGGIVSAATNGTQRALTKALMDSVILNCKNAGGEPSVMMVSNYNKTVFSTFLDDANIVAVRQSVSPGGKLTLKASAEIYESDFGKLTVMPNDQMTRAGADVARNVFLFDPEMVSVGMYRDMKRHKVAKTGDTEKRVLNTEYTLLMHNEAAHGCIADTFGLTAST